MGRGRKEQPHGLGLVQFVQPIHQGVDDLTQFHQAGQFGRQPGDDVAGGPARGVEGLVDPGLDEAPHGQDGQAGGGHHQHQDGVGVHQEEAAQHVSHSEQRQKIYQQHEQGEQAVHQADAGDEGPVQGPVAHDGQGEAGWHQQQAEGQILDVGSHRLGADVAQDGGRQEGAQAQQQPQQDDAHLGSLDGPVAPQGAPGEDDQAGQEVDQHVDEGDGFQDDLGGAARGRRVQVEHGHREEEKAHAGNEQQAQPGSVAGLAGAHGGELQEEAQEEGGQQELQEILQVFLDHHVGNAGMVGNAQQEEGEDEAQAEEVPGHRVVAAAEDIPADEQEGQPHHPQAVVANEVGLVRGHGDQQAGVALVPALDRDGLGR